MGNYSYLIFQCPSRSWRVITLRVVLWTPGARPCSFLAGSRTRMEISPIFNFLKSCLRGDGDDKLGQAHRITSDRSFFPLTLRKEFVWTSRAEPFFLFPPDRSEGIFWIPVCHHRLPSSYLWNVWEDGLPVNMTDVQTDSTGTFRCTCTSNIAHIVYNSVNSH